MWAVPHGSRADRVLLCLHGGGFVGGSIYTHRKMFGHLAKATGARALLTGYRLLPEGGCYPAPVDDVGRLPVAAGPGHRRRSHRVRRGLGGGWLAITVQLRAREPGLPLPAARLLISPCVDLAVTGESYDANRDKDPFFNREVVQGLVSSFLGGAADPGIRGSTRCTPT